ncbi:hypothetical protein VNI00_007068 [Paramarasmius palmivorus]|uniref:F-box domain-containing protein n=1 Tax=Paramarasmius palmivorus TaxID=297713 RepID=A0AAW0D425_9AGAR
MDSTDRLPSEILVKIFKVGRDEELDFSRRTINLPYALIRNSSVSVRWRTIALSTPELWSYIQIPFDLLQSQSRAVEWVKIWIERSSSETCPLNISIECPGRYEGLLAPVFDCIIPHAERWRSFRFQSDINPSTSPSLLSPLETVHAPSLEEFSVDLVDWTEVDMSGWNFLRLGRPLAEETDVRSFFASTPNLRVLTLRGIPTHFPFEHLTSLELQNVTFIGDAALRDIADRCPDLEILTLRFLSFTSNNQMSSEPIHMASLQKLIIMFDFNQSFTESNHKHALTLLEVPKLSYMKIVAMEFLSKLHNFLPEPSKLMALRDLELEQVPPRWMNPRTGAYGSNAPYFLSLPHVTHVHLKDTPGEILGIDLASTVDEPKRTRTRSGSLGRPTPRASQERDISRLMLGKKSDTIVLPPQDPGYTPDTWPHLEAISLDCTINPQNLIWLCRVIAARPQIQLVALSDAAYKHLLFTLVMRERIADGTVHLGMRNLGFFTDFNQSHDEGEGHEVELNAVAWLADKVKLIPLVTE